MNAWTEAGLKAALDDSDKMLIAAETLNMALGADKVVILPDDVSNILRRMTHILERMQNTVVITKRLATYKPGQ